MSRALIKASSVPDWTLARGEPWTQAEWQRLWLATQGQPWRVLGLVPAGRGGPVDFTVDVAASLARTGMMHLGIQIHVADATQLSLEHAADFGEQLRSTMRDGRVILALPPIIESPLTVPLAQAADCAVLCVLLRQMRLPDAKKTIEEVGRQRFIGAITFD